MKIQSIYLEAFYEVAKIRNFTEAAKKLGITQSAFSNRISKLEVVLSSKVVTRDKKNIQLTEIGETLLRYVEKVKKLEESLIKNISNESKLGNTGTLRIGGFSSILRSIVLPGLQPLLLNNPDLSIELVSKELRELYPLLKNSQVDFIFTNRAQEYQGIISELIGHEDNVLVESNIIKNKNCYLDHDFHDVTTSSYFKLRPELRTSKTTYRYLDDVYGLLDGVSLGLGRAILPKHLIKNRKDLKILYPKTKLRVPIYLSYYENEYATEFDRVILENLRLTKNQLSLF